MQFPESWLREFCNPDLTTQQLADVLTMAGLEVEEVRPAAPPFSGVVVGEVLALEKHPNADRLNVCQVNVGGAVILNVVCGAPNVRVGIKVPCAMVGALLPAAGDAAEPFEIKLGKLRGVESQGMLCSARELGLSQEHDGLLVLPGEAVVGSNIRAQLALDDALFTLKLTPNLGHALSVYGVAREVSALTNTALIAPVINAVVASGKYKVAINIEAADLCGRFSGRVIRGVNHAAASPAWMVQRLERCGQRSVSALVDISNYVMFECGQPTHIFDLDKISGGLTVRWGKPGETLKLLNGSTVTLDAAVGVIADDSAVESLAGIMGGDATAVTGSTRNIYVEAAFWWPEAVAGRSRRFNFSTDAGHRFERGVDPALTAQTVERITQLIVEICGGQPGPVDDNVANLPVRQPVTLRAARAARVIGMPISVEQCAAVFTKLGLPFVATSHSLSVTPPLYRFDLTIEEDLIEEVARVIGYQQLPETPPIGPISARLRLESQRGPFALRRSVAALDYQETINYSFVEAQWERDFSAATQNTQPIRVLNPISSHMSVMRSTLLGSLVDILKFNVDRKQERVRLFELGRVYMRDAQAAASLTGVATLDQPLRLAGLAYGAAQPLQWSAAARSVDFFDVKGDLQHLFPARLLEFARGKHPALHPGRSATVLLDGVDIGVIGELHPKLRQAYGLPSGSAAPIVFELDAAACLAQNVPAYMPVARFQPVQRDLSVVVRQNTPHAALQAAVNKVNQGGTASQGLIRSCTLFDTYKPKQPVADMAADEHSIAVRFELLDDSATLTELQIDTVMGEILLSLQQQLGARLRA